MSDRLRRKAERDIKYMFEQLDSVDVDAIRTDGVTMRIGDKILRLVVDEDSPPVIEEQVREEFRNKLAEKLQLIKENINAKISEMSEFVNTLRREYESKERELQKRIDSVQAFPPEMNYNYLRQGLSVCKGDYRNEVYYIVNGLYWPKYVDRQAIEPSYTKKMISHIVLLFRTEGNKIKELSTRKPFGLDYFAHYHQAKPDCWGKWKYPTTFSSCDDIIKIAQEAQIVLENINVGSIANRTPRGLPRKETLMRHLLPEGEGTTKMKNLRQETRRLGARKEGIEINEENFWSA